MKKTYNLGFDFGTIELLDGVKYFTRKSDGLLIAIKNGILIFYSKVPKDTVGIFANRVFEFNPSIYDERNKDLNLKKKIQKEYGIVSKSDNISIWTFDERSNFYSDVYQFVRELKYLYTFYDEIIYHKKYYITMNEFKYGDLNSVTYLEFDSKKEYLEKMKDLKGGITKDKYADKWFMKAVGCDGHVVEGKIDC